MHHDVYDQLKNKPRLENKSVCSQSGNGSELKFDGCISVTVCIGNTEIPHEFYAIRELSRNMILDLDWIKSNNFRIFMNLKCRRINDKQYVKLQEDIHIASTLRMKNTCLFKPQTAIICNGKVRENQIKLQASLMK